MKRIPTSRLLKMLTTLIMFYLLVLPLVIFNVNFLIINIVFACVLTIFYRSLNLIFYELKTLNSKITKKEEDDKIELLKS